MSFCQILDDAESDANDFDADADDNDVKDIERNAAAHRDLSIERVCGCLYALVSQTGL